MHEMKVFLKLIPYFANVRASMIAGVVTGIFHQLVAIASSALGAYLVSLAILGNPPSLIAWGIVFMVLLVIARTVLSYAEMWYAHKAAYGILAEFRVLIYRAIERIAPSYLMGKRTGELSSTLMSDVETLEWFYAHTYGSALVAVIVPTIVLVVVAALIHPLVAVVIVPWLVLTVTVPFWFKRRSDVDGSLIRERLAAINAEVVDGIQGVREILAFGYESQYLRHLRTVNRALTSVQQSYGRRQGVESGLINFCMAAGLLSVTAVSVFLVNAGVMDRGVYPVALILSIYVFTPVVAISQMARSFGIMQSSTDRVFTVLEAQPTVVDKVSESAPIADPTGIAFDHVSFRYAEDAPVVLKDVSFEVKPGEVVALVGHSGSGKSTCVNLIQRFWDVEGGAAVVGGQDVRSLTQDDLRSLISLVPQDVYLFNCSILDNIRLGVPEATRDDVVRAATDARIDSFISGLPDGYDTVCGERGVQLSGGERQRIAIARALLCDKPILLMDEAVSNLDAANEKELRAALARLYQDRTTLIVAHRLSTIRSADRILVLEDGVLAEQGTHEELISHEGAYARLLRSGLTDT